MRKILAWTFIIGTMVAGSMTSRAADQITVKQAAAPVDPASIDLTKPTLFVVPYSHLDDIWRWNYPQTIRDFLKNTLDDNFAAFHKYPNFTFNWSGASRYAMMKEYYPEKYEELKQWVAAGRWFPSGSAWVENDTNIPCTESQVRQLLLGHKYFKDEFGKESREYMLPDCFGFPHSLPSVLNHCGILGFSTQKLTWGSANGIPFNIGRWIGPDGNSVIAALNAGDYARAHTSVYSTDKKTLRRLKENKERSGLPIDYYYMGGGDKNNADRGGSPQKVSLKNLEKAYATEGPIHVIAGPSDLMFRAISKEQEMKLPIWERDLLLIQHSTGVLTSQAYQKQLNRQGELLADAAERAAVSAAYLNGAVYPAEQLRKAWELTLRNQFHDTLPGTSLPIAHAFAWNDGIISLNTFDGVYRDAIGSLARSLNTDQPGVPLVIYNPLSMQREDVVEALIPRELAKTKAITAFDAKGKALPTQVTTGWDGKRRVMFLAKVPPIGAAAYFLRKGTSPKPEKSELHVDAKKNVLENSRYRVKIDKNGDIARVFDKLLGKELLEKPAQLEFIADFPDRKPAWRIYFKDSKQPARSVAANPVHIRVVENGPVRVALEILRNNEGSKILQRIRLAAGGDGNRVEVANHFDWKSRGALLKAAFHFKASNPKATYNLDLGTIERGNYNKKQYEVPSHGWIDLTDKSGSHGATILTGCKYGSDKPDDNTLRLTLIHSPNTEKWEDETQDRGRTKEMRWQDWGRHEIRYAITGHKGDWREGQPHHEALRFEQPLAAFVVPRYNGPKGSSFSLMTINTPQVNIQAVKMAENGSGVIVRMQELFGRPCSGAKLSAALPFTAAEKLDGVERPLNKRIAVRDNSLIMDFSPCEIKTVLLSMPGLESKTMTKSIALNYDCDVFSYNTDREDGFSIRENIKGLDGQVAGSSGSFDGKGGTYPAEMIGDTVEQGNVSFKIGPRTPRSFNAVACRGQEIELPKGTKVLHLLAAADKDTDAIFRAGNIDLPLSIGGWSGNIGQWDYRVFDGEVAELSYSLRNDLLRIDPAYVRNQRVAWFASHRHKPACDTLYEYGYMFSYRLEIPEGSTNITLPKLPFVRIMAMSVGDESHAKALQSPFEDMHRDDDFTASFGDLNTPEVND